MITIIKHHSWAIAIISSQLANPLAVGPVVAMARIRWTHGIDSQGARNNFSKLLAAASPWYWWLVGCDF